MSSYTVQYSPLHAISDKDLHQAQVIAEKGYTAVTQLAELTGSHLPAVLICGSIMGIAICLAGMEPDDGKTFEEMHADFMAAFDRDVRATVIGLRAEQKINEALAKAEAMGVNTTPGNA